MPLYDALPEVLTRDLHFAEFGERIALLVGSVCIVVLAGVMWNEAARHRDAVPVALMMSAFPVVLASVVLIRRRLVIDRCAGTVAVGLVLAGLPISRRRTIDLPNLEAVAITPIEQRATIWRVALVHDHGQVTTLSRRFTRETAAEEAQAIADELGLEVRLPPPRPQSTVA